MKNATPLADILSELRRELDAAKLEGEGKGLHFRVESIDVELQVTVSKSAEAGGGFKFWVINGDAKGRVASESLQKLHLKLNPYHVAADGSEKPLDVNREGDLGGPSRTN